MIDVVTIGAGGGSIAWFDPGGALKVTPEGAGADLGPASYNKGGKDITVTGVNLILGRLNPEYYLGGRVRIYPELARHAMPKARGLFKKNAKNDISILFNFESIKLGECYPVSFRTNSNKSLEYQKTIVFLFNSGLDVLSVTSRVFFKEVSFPCSILC